MKNFLKYILAVLRNEKNVYIDDNRNLRELVLFVILLFITVLFLAVPIFRLVLTWFAYVSTGLIGMYLCVMIIANIIYLINKYREHMGLVTNGRSEEEVEEMRRKLCEEEGDDGLSSNDTESPSEKPIYFMDASALLSYADPLYGCFLAKEFNPESIGLEKDAVLYTRFEEIEVIGKSETYENIPGRPYPGYAGFLCMMLKLVPNMSSENLVFEREAGVEVHPTTADEMNVALALHISMSEGANVTMISKKEEVHELAKCNFLTCKKPLEEV